MTIFLKSMRPVIPVVFIVLLVLSLPAIRIDNSLERWVPPGSSEITRYKEFLERFGGDAALLIAFRYPGNFEGEEAQTHLMDFWERAEGLPEVNGVSSFPPPFYRLKRRPADDVRAFLLTFTPPSHLDPNRPELLAAVRDLLEATPLESHLAGTGVIHEAINEETLGYTRSFIGLGLAFLAVLLFLVLKSPRAFLMTLGVSAGGVATLLLAAAAFRIPLSLAAAVLPVLVLFYGTSGSLHVLFHRGDFRQVLGPCLMAAATTAIGFLTFWPSPIPLLKDFALLAAAGIVGGFVWALFLFFPRRYVFAPRAGIEGAFRRSPVPSSPAFIVLFLAAGAAAVPGLLKLRADIDSLAILSPAHRAAIDQRFIEANVTRFVPLEYTVETDKVETSRLNHWVSAVLELEEVDGAVSYLGILPEERVGARYLSADGRTGRVTFFVPMLSTTRGLALAGKVEALAAGLLPGVELEVNGYVTLYAVVAEELKKAFLESLALAFVLIFIVMGLYLRDLRLFAASVLPNVVPIIFVLGLMGWSGLTLSMATTPIGCLMLGILVDNTFHLLYWFRRTGTMPEAFREAAPGMVLTSVILAVGFSVFLLASSPPVRQFGLLSLAALAAGLAGDCVLLPVLVRMFARKPASEAAHG
ncbi:MAG: hypothetical protein JW747_10725 [Candidatus Aminicenantes bacterium]|nr:hypothetical protein [Candidatus Aminicenantes bacterium]